MSERAFKHSDACYEVEGDVCICGYEETFWWSLAVAAFLPHFARFVRNAEVDRLWRFVSEEAEAAVEAARDGRDTVPHLVAVDYFANELAAMARGDDRAVPR